MKIDYYSVEKPIEGVCKQSAIWICTDNNKLAPLVYLKRPKWIVNDALWEKIVKSVRLDIQQDLLTNYDNN